MKNRGLLLTLSLLLLPCTALAQVQTGTPPFGSYTGGPDVINLANLNAHITIPVVNKRGRGMNFTYNLSYDSSVWYPAGVIGSQTWQPVDEINWGWRAQTEMAIGYISMDVVSTGLCTYNGEQYHGLITYGDWVYNDAFGTPHPFAGTANAYLSPCQGDSSLNVVTTDGSGWTLHVAITNDAISADVNAASGGTITPPAGPVGSGTGYGIAVDANGNEITASGTGTFTDTLGTTVVSVSGTAPNPEVITYTGPKGPESYTVKYTTQTVQTNFGCNGIADFGAHSESLVGEIDLPDGSKYTFTYEPTPGYPGSVTGRVASVTLPTGGTITYAYSGGSEGITCADGSTATLTRTVSPGSPQPSGTWTYAHSENGTAWSTTVTDPQGNQTALDFQGIYETERQVYQGSQGGTLLKEVDTCYNGAAAPCTDTPISFPFSQRTIYTKLFNGSTTLESEQDSLYNTYGLPTEEDSYGYGSGAPGPVLRKVAITYASLGNNIVDKPSSITVQDGTGATVAETNYSYDETAVVPTSGTPQHIAVSGARGNPTTVQRLISSSTYATTTLTYFDTGNVDQITDQYGHSITYTYGDCGNSLPTVASRSPELSLAYQWNCNGGVQTSSTDPNGNTTTYGYAGEVQTNYFWRPTQISYPDGGWKLITYPSQTETDMYTGIASATASTSCSSCRRDEALVDGLGRPSATYLASDPAGQDQVEGTYDSVGRVSSVTNPYRAPSDPTYGDTQAAYDSLNRPTAVTQPDGSIAHVYYGSDVASHGGNGNQGCSISTYGYGYPALTVDAAGSKREVWTDSFGRTIEADEPNAAGSMAEATCYQYNANGNLIAVLTPTGQARTYTYDDLGHVITVTAPESGTTTYTYDADGDLLTRVAPLENQTDPNKTVLTSYNYDSLNRLLQIGYSDGTPTVNYSYGQSVVYFGSSPFNVSNGKGRRTSMTDATGQTAWSYDAMGRVVTEKRTIAGKTKTISYSYNLDGSLASLTYPDGLVVSYAYNNAQEATQATSAHTNYAIGAAYAPQGALSSVHLGEDLETWGYNSDLEATSVVASTGTVTALNLSYGYALPGGNNGSVAGITNGLDSGRDETMTYDPLNRILSAETAATSGQDCWGLNFGSGGLADDTLGNLLAMTPSKCSGPALSLSVNGNNQITNTGFGYDAAGNMTNDGQRSYTYNAENQVTSGFSYDGDGLMVEAGDLYWRAYTGQKLEDTDTSGFTQQDIIYFNGRPIAWIDATGNVRYMFADTQGSIRAVTDSSGNVSCTADYYPYGQEVGSGCGSSPYGFAGYEELDNGSGNVYAFARFYSPRLGRFLSADPLGGDASNPQTLNRYAYVVNNPTNYTDPSGLWCDPGLTQCTPANSPWENGPFSGYSDTELFSFALTPTGQEWVPDTSPDCLATGDCGPGAFVPVYGNMGLLLSGLLLGQPSGTALSAASQAPLTHCQQTVLSAVNNQFGTNLNGSDVLPSSNPLPAGGGEVNVNFGVNSGLSPAQFNAIQPGRYAPPGVLGLLTGYGPSLHVVAGPTALDPNVLTFTNSNLGGAYTVSFTAHMDSAWADNPIGALFHLFIDVFGHKTRNPCP